MADITRWSPFRDLTRFDPFRDFEDMFKDMRLRPMLRGADIDPQIRMDVSEQDDAYLVKAEIPGVTKDDINVSIDGNQVAISAEVKKESKEEKDGKVLHSERYYGSVYRAFTLGSEVDDGRAEAKYENGVLQLRLPKKPVSGGTKKLSIS